MRTRKTGRPNRGNNHSNPKSSSVKGKEKLKQVPNDEPPSAVEVAESVAKHRVAGTDYPELADHLVDQLCDSVWLTANMQYEEGFSPMTASFAALAGIRPRDELEGMLAVQAIATHNAAMEFLRRATLQKTTVGFDLYLKHAEKLLRIYKEQMEVLNRSRRTK